jgi:hypothetical protein
MAVADVLTLVAGFAAGGLGALLGIGGSRFVKRRASA